MTATVTLSQAYFETLLRRAEFHTSGRDLSTPIDVPLVTIPKVDHDNLLRLAEEYCRLREALSKGGIEQETLEILIHNEQPPSGPLNHWAIDDEAGKQATGLFSPPNAARFIISRSSNGRFNNDEHFDPRYQPSSMAGDRSDQFRSARTFSSRHNSSAGDDNDFSFIADNEKDEGYLSTPRPERRRYERSEQRSIVARNLHERTTHKDITNIVRGGLLLDIHLRQNEKTAFISFVEGQHALNFMNYVKRNDICIHGKRIEWSWGDRQFILPGHVAGKIGIGATRNVVIRNCSPKITEDKIRDDLDHIHNLVIIDIAAVHGDCYISLNSIHNSLFARSCMMSRAAYKGMKIEWYEDDCCLPLPQPRRTPKENLSPPKRKLGLPMNRFQMLGLDGDDSEDAEDDAESDIVTTTTDMTKHSITGRTPWDASSMVAAS